LADPDVAAANLSRDHAEALAALRLFHPQERLGQPLAEPSMDLTEPLGGGPTPLQSALVDPLLDRDVRSGLELQVPLDRVGAVVVVDRSLDVDGVGIVALDQVAVVAIHRPYEVGEGGQHPRGEAAAKAG